MYRPDTSEEAQRVYDRQVRQLTDEQRFLRGLSLTHLSREICLSSLRKKNPGMPLRELRVRFFETIYGALFPPEEKEKISAFL